MRHCLQAIIGSPVSLPARSRFISTFSVSTPRSRSLEFIAKRELEPWQAKATKRLLNKTKKRDEGRGAGNPTKRRSTIKSREQADREASLHLKFLKDPIKLAHFVRETLRENNYELAQAVVNEASSSMPCIVSWNHIIEWHLSKGKMNGALKCYNEVSQQP
jgi:hypothetical protein